MNVVALDCSTIKGTALNSYAYKTDGSVQFEFAIPTPGNVYLTFPTYWSDSPSISPLITGTTTCREVNFLKIIKTLQSITCTQDNLKFTCNTLQAGSQIIRCNNVKGPHTNKQIGNFRIQFAQQSCDNILINNFQPYGGSVVFSSNSTTGLYPNVDKLQMIWENIVLPISFSSNPQIEVQILSNGEFVTTSTVKGYVSARSIGLLESLTVSAPNLIKAQMPQSIAVKDVSMKLYMESLKVLGNTQPIQSQIDFKDSDNVLQYQILFPTIQVQNDQLTASLNIASTEINIYTKYTFSITIKNALNSAGFVRIALAQTLLSQNLICYCDNTVSIPTINADYIDVGGCLTTTGTHNIAIQNVLNPVSTISTITISYIQTMLNGFSVDRMTNFQYKSPSFTPGTLSVQYDRQGSDLDVVGGYSFFILKITPKNRIPAQGLLKVEIPQEIKFVNQNAQICNVDIYGCQIQTIQDQVLIFKFSSSIEASKQFIINSISIPIRNPLDTSQTNYFKFTTYDQFNNIIDKISNVQGYSVNKRSSFDGLIIIESDQPFKNGQSNTFYFTIKTKTPQFYPIQMTVKVGDLTINNNPQCKLEGAVIKTCTKISANQLDISIQSTTDQLLLPTTLKLSVSTIKCKDTMTKSQDFEFSTQSTNGLMSYQSGPYISNVQFGDITQTELRVDKQYYGASNAVYQFNFALQNGLIQGNHQVHILFPFNLPSSGYSCKDTTNKDLVCNVQSKNILVLTGPFDSTQLLYKVIVNGLPTPQNEQQPRTFTIKTYRKIDDSNYLVDSSVNGAFQFNIYCPQLNNCRTCNINDSNNVDCETCYASTISKFIYMKSSVCVDNCGDGYYQNDQEFSCQQCPSNCQVCSPTNSVLICDKCFDNYKYQDSICVDTCGDAYYLPLTSTNKCERCDSECMLCSMNSSYCSKCQPNIPIQANKCYKNGCLQGFYQTYNSNQVLVCELCPATCISCHSYNQCTECQPSQYYLSGSCRADCPLGYFINGQEMLCKQCVSGCSQCSNDTACVKCQDGFLLKEQKCVLACGDQYYMDTTQTSCLRCNQYCQTCEVKDEVQKCTSCMSSYFFFNFTCIQQCGSNYYSLNHECFECSQNCLTCAGSPDTCTSCLVQGDTPQFLDGTVCVSKCSDTQFADITSGKCIECPSNCTKCTSLTNCSQCNQSVIPHYLIQGACKQQCPTNYQPIGLLCEFIPERVVINTEPNRYVPVPHVIIFAFFTISVLLSKQFKSETYMPGSIIGLSALLVWSSWFAVLFLLLNYYEFKELYYFWILIGSVGLNYVFNALHLVLVYQKIWNDQDFLRWQASSLKNKSTNVILVSLSILFAYPLYKLIMSRYFGFSFFKAKIVDIKPLFYFNCLNALYITFVNVPIIVSCILVAYHESSHNTQTFISAIDSIVVTFSYILLLIWETQKGESFFDEFHQNYYFNESKQHLGKNEISGYFQHPFEQKSQAEQKIDLSDLDAQAVNQENDVTKQKSQQQSHDQSCNLNGISIILSDKNSNPVFQQESDRSNQFPQKQVVPSNLKHTIYYKNVQINQLENPDDEPPYESPGSENFSSMKSQSSQNCQQSFNDQSQYPLKDISLIQDSEEPHENSQLSIFQDERNQSPSKKQNTLQLQQILDNHPLDHYNIIPTFENENDENNPQQVNQLNEKSKSSCKKTQQQMKNNEGQQNPQQNLQSSSSRREILQPLQYSQVQQLAKSAQFNNDKALSSHKTLSRESQSTETIKIQLGQCRQQGLNQVNPQVIEQLQQTKLVNTKNNDQIPKQGIYDRQQQQIGVSNSQTQSDTESQNDQCRIQILMDSRAIEEEQDIFQDQIQIQQIKAKSSNMKEDRKQSKIKGESELNNIFDSSDSIHTMSDQDWSENQISPSEFNSLNQRFEDEQELDLQIHLPNQSKTQQHYRQCKLIPLNLQFRDENNDEQPNIGQTYVDFTRNSQPQKETKKQQLEKVYLQKLEKNDKISSRTNKWGFKKKHPIKNHPKDISDAYIDDQIDVEDINF